MSTTRKVALVGAGVIGTQHGLVISELADRIELVAVADVEIDRAERLAAHRGGRPYPSLTAALAAEEIDVVVVCTPTGRHAEVAVEALEAGKHVIVEKPAEITVQRTDEIIKAQQKAGTLVTVISLRVTLETNRQSIGVITGAYESARTDVSAGSLSRAATRRAFAPFEQLRWSDQH